MNFLQETPSRYIIKNQNGLNNAIYDYFGATDNNRGFTYSKKEIRLALQNWPTSYPSRITIISQMFECGRFYLEIEPITSFNFFFASIFNRSSSIKAKFHTIYLVAHTNYWQNYVGEVGRWSYIGFFKYILFYSFGYKVRRFKFISYE